MTIYELMKKLMQYSADAKVDYKIIIGTDNGCDTLLYEEPLDKKEYEEPSVDWSKVPVDTPILVRDHKENAWKKRYFAKYENGIVYTWCAGTTSWSACGSGDITDWKMAKLAEEVES